MATEHPVGGVFREPGMIWEDVTHQGNVGVQAMAGVLKIEDPLQFARIMEAVRAKREAEGKVVEAEAVEG